MTWKSSAGLLSLLVGVAQAGCFGSLPGPDFSGDASPDDVDTLERVANNIEGRTICAFGEACAWPTQSFVKKFRDEMKAPDPAAYEFV